MMASYSPACSRGIGICYHVHGLSVTSPRPRIVGRIGYDSASRQNDAPRSADLQVCPAPRSRPEGLRYDALREEDMSERQISGMEPRVLGVRMVPALLVLVAMFVHVTPAA